jgi:hypothetical protein
VPGALATGNTLLHRGPGGAGELRLVLPKGIIARGHGSVDTSLQIPRAAQLVDDPSADLVDDPSNLRIAGRLDLDKAGRETLVRAIDIDGRFVFTMMATLADTADHALNI